MQREKPGAVIEMKTTLSNSRTEKLYEALLIGLVAFAVGLLPIFGHTKYHSAWAQSQDDGDGPASQYTVTLNDVTWGNRFKWAAQAIVAPERLEGLVPIYVYKMDDIKNNSFEISKYPDLHVGVAGNEKNVDREVWKARPVPPARIQTLIENYSSKGSDGGYPPYIVSSKPLAGGSVVENLWIPERAWQEGLERARQGGLGGGESPVSGSTAMQSFGGS